MAVLTPVPEGVKVPTDTEARDYRSAIAIAKRSRPIAPMSAKSVEIFLQLGTVPGERTFLPTGWPKDPRSVATLAELRRIDANWTWDKATKLVWLDGVNLMVSEVADRLGVTVAPVKASKPRKASTFRVVDGATVPVFAPKVAEVAPVVEPAPVVADPCAPTCSRCSRPSELPTCQTCQDSLADDQARRPVNLGGDGSPLAEYLGRLVHEPKRLYALELVAHLRDGGPAPVSDAAWAPKVDAKVRRYLRAA